MMLLDWWTSLSHEAKCFCLVDFDLLIYAKAGSGAYNTVPSNIEERINYKCLFLKWNAIANFENILLTKTLFVL